MDSHERVEKTLRHQEPDRVPVDLWVSKEIEAALLEYYGAMTFESVLERLQVDFCYIEGPKYRGPQMTVREDGSQEDHFGVPRRIVNFEARRLRGTYREVSGHPLATACSADEVECYPKWPDPDWFDYECVRQQAKRARETGRVVVFMGDRINRCAQLKPAMYLRGVDRILMDLLISPDIAQSIFDRCTAFYSEYARRVLEAAAGCVDIFFTGDDFGMQTNAFMAPALWRQFLREGFQRFIDLGHAHGCWVAHHTCGAVIDLIPDFVACGLDILNPLQPEAAGMDFKRIQREFGASLTFHGGISIQSTMPFGTTSDVQEEVRAVGATLGPGGGFIYCTAHNLQADVPLDNVDALFRAYRQYGAYGETHG